ncbi:hypothetical protein LUZ60_007494 [Juncus effusus]|nr:hypothetical protein LUZ60_007494 [Juncus effusus]
MYVCFLKEPFSYVVWLILCGVICGPYVSYLIWRLCEHMQCYFNTNFKRKSTSPFNKKIKDRGLFNHHEEEKGKTHKKHEHLGEMGTLAAESFALHEKKAETKDPEHAHRHKIEAKIAEGAAIMTGGYAFHERHEKKKEHEEKKKEHKDGEKKHHFF